MIVIENNHPSVCKLLKKINLSKDEAATKTCDTRKKVRGVSRRYAKAVCAAMFQTTTKSPDVT